jgi:hypothetical protein
VAPTGEAAKQALRVADTSVPAGSAHVNDEEDGAVVVVVVVGGAVVVVVVDGGRVVDGDTVVGAATFGDDAADPRPGWVVVGGLTVGGAALAGAGAKVVRPVNTIRPDALEGCEPTAGPAAVAANPSVDAASATTMAAVSPKYDRAPNWW